MRTIGLSVAMGLALSALFAPAANAQQQPTIFFCAAPAGHVCQFAVQTGAHPLISPCRQASESSSPASFRTRPSIVFATAALSRWSLFAKFIERSEFSLCSRGGAAGAQAGVGLSCVTRSI